MKKVILGIAAAAAVLAPMAMASGAAAQPGAYREYRQDRREARQDFRQERRQDRRDYQHGDFTRREFREERRDARRDFQRERWDDRRDFARRQDRWDSRRYNGYYYNNRWSYGPPPAAYWDRPGFRPGYSSWRRGAYLPNYYRGYVVNDYGRYRLRPPPRGYAWYRVNDDYLLAAVASGLIFDIITGY